MRSSIGVLAVALLCACGERVAGRGAPADEQNAAVAEAPAPFHSPARAAPPQSIAPAGLALPPRFTALGTEPFWAARVDGDRLTYLTPEDQAGRTVAVTRISRGGLVELEGMLSGARLTLSVSEGRCSDGMSDTVYPFSVRRRVGDDEQRGCARPN